MTIIHQDGAAGKVCRVCEQWKPVEGFDPHKRSKDGYEHVCSECRIPRKAKVVHTFQDGVEGKICTVCEAWKALDEFNHDSVLSDGKSNKCRQCANDYLKGWREADPERHKRKSRESYHRHADARRATVKRYVDNNRELVSSRNKVRNRAWYAANKERAKIYARVRQDRKRRNGTGSYTPQEWRDLCDYYQHTCLRCGRREPEIQLTPDHIIPLSKLGSNTIDNIQPLCLDCNLWKFTKIIDFRPYFRPPS